MGDWEAHLAELRQHCPTLLEQIGDDVCSSSVAELMLWMDRHGARYAETNIAAAADRQAARERVRSAQPSTTVDLRKLCVDCSSRLKLNSS